MLMSCPPDGWNERETAVIFAWLSLALSTEEANEMLAYLWVAL